MWKDILILTAVIIPLVIIPGIVGGCEVGSIPFGHAVIMIVITSAIELLICKVILIIVKKERK